MTTHIRHLAVLAGLALGSVTAQAQVTRPWDGFGHLTWSEDAVNVLNIGNMKVSSFGDTLFHPAFEWDGRYSGIAVQMASTGAQWLPSVDTPNQLVSWQTAGGFRIDAPVVLGISKGGNVTVNDLDVNFATGQISATVQAGNAGTSTRDVIWTFNSSLVQVTNDPSPLPPLGLWPSLFHHDISIATPTLSMTSTGQNLIAAGLNLDVLGKMAFQDTASNYASLTLNGTLQGPYDFKVSVVPEPGTWALMGLGLVGLAGLHRTRSRQECATSA